MASWAIGTWISTRDLHIVHEVQHKGYNGRALSSLTQWPSYGGQYLQSSFLCHFFPEHVQLAIIAHVHVVGIIVVILVVELLELRNNLDLHFGLVTGIYLQGLVNLLHFLYDNTYDIWMEGDEWRHHSFFFLNINNINYTFGDVKHSYKNHNVLTS